MEKPTSSNNDNDNNNNNSIQFNSILGFIYVLYSTAGRQLQSQHEDTIYREIDENSTKIPLQYAQVKKHN